ncbi:LysR family transcriptional regulator [Peribacillus frigoritolerans]|uniref:LysR family transcriptional regulator n=1 Tax=Peribacillus frigoritolerans TaxID=450367 RepID=UPI003F859C85
MELRNLKTFQVAARLLNFTKTAEDLNFAQPTVTAQIQSLEQELNQPLFFRVGKNTFLTPVGKTVEKYTYQIFSLIDEMEQEIQKTSGEQKTITIAASEIFCTYYLPHIISEYLKAFPDVQVKILSCHSDAVIKGIESTEYDIGIITGKSNRSGIKDYVFLEEEWVLVVSKNLYSQYTVDHLFETFPLIEYNDNHFGYHYKQMKEFINKCRLPVHRTIEMSSDEAIKKAALNHIGIGLLTKNFVVEEILSGELVPVLSLESDLKLKNSLIVLEEKLNVTAIKSFWDIMQSYRAAKN